MPTLSEQDTRHSSHREMLIEQLLVGVIARHLWLNGTPDLEILKPMVDEAGYDLVLEANNVIRHVQLKSSSRLAKTSRTKVNVKLARKPSGCVVWVRFDPRTIDLGPFLWFGGPPGEPLPPISHFKIAKHTKGNAQGAKLPRAGIREIPRSRFESIESIPDLVERLFGTPGRRKSPP